MPKILHKKLKSSTIQGAEYNIDKKELIITFLSGDKYKYEKVEMEIYIGLINADSCGKYLWRMIRDKYKTAKI